MAAAAVIPPEHDQADPTLCQRCQSFDIQAFSRSQTPWRGYRVGDIADSASSGCPFCSYLARYLDHAGFKIYTKKHDDNSKAEWIHFRVLRAVNDPDSQPRPENPGLDITYLQVFSEDRVGNGTEETPLLEFHVVADPDDPASTSGDVVGRYAIRDASSQDSIDVIKSWLATCAENHMKCSRTLSGESIATPTPLPTRCLQVISDPMVVGGIRICLVETASRNGSYTTMTHRWPKQLRGATTSTNLADRLSGKETLESILPRHFVDACILTLRLGYEYIWIDAVCIIQGASDPAAMVDWAHEATWMASYYQNSRLTIAATYGDGTRGLFIAETLENSRPLIRLPYRGRSGSVSPRPSYFYLIPSDCHFNKDYEDHVARSELLTRGWVVQEWVLSRRILCYTPASVYFQCMEEFPHNEDGRVITIRKHGEEEAGEDGAFRMRLDRNRSFGLELKNLDLSYKRWYIYDIWREIVESYSQRSLTRPETDKLMGIIGIANEFGRALVGQLRLNETKSRIWVAGLWLKDIYIGLLWEQSGHLPASARGLLTDRHDAGRIAQIPSWSWASRIPSVEWGTFRLEGMRVCCEVSSVRDARARQPDIATATSPTAAERAGDDWESLPILGHDPGPDQARLVDPTKTFPALCIQGRRISILIRETFVDGEEWQIAGIITGAEELGRRWRKAALLSSPDRICGWVSLDRERNSGHIQSDGEAKGDSSLAKHHKAGAGRFAVGNDEAAGASSDAAIQKLPTPNIAGPSQEQVVPEQGNGNIHVPGDQEAQILPQTGIETEGLIGEAQALLILTGTKRLGGYPLGSKRSTFSYTHPVYHILCLRHYPDETTAAATGFERIGVGVLFGRDVERLFSDAQRQESCLF